MQRKFNTNNIYVDKYFTSYLPCEILTTKIVFQKVDFSLLQNFLQIKDKSKFFLKCVMFLYDWGDHPFNIYALPCFF